MECSYFTIKALTMVALLFFVYNVTSHTADAINFVWSVEICTDEDSDLDTEQFPLPEKCPTPPPYEPQLPLYENN